MDTSLRLSRHAQNHPTAPAWDYLPRNAAGKLVTHGYEVSKRTVERDLVRLSGPFPLVTEGSHPEYWSWMPGAEALALPDHDPMSALTWQLVEEYLQPLLPLKCQGRARAAVQLCQKLPPRLWQQKKLRRWKHRVRYLPRAMPLPPPKNRLGRCWKPCTPRFWKEPAAPGPLSLSRQSQGQTSHAESSGAGGSGDGLLSGNRRRAFRRHRAHCPAPNESAKAAGLQSQGTGRFRSGYTLSRTAAFCTHQVAKSVW